jgi:hypothetical protein
MLWFEVAVQNAAAMAVSDRIQQLVEKLANL